MAITRADYDLFGMIRGELPDSPSILEIGEAEFYGDVPEGDLLADVQRYGDAPIALEVRRLFAAARAGDVDCHALARQVYATFFRPSVVVAIDLGGTDRACKFDLNYPLELRHYDLVYNTGTAEHCFDIARVLRTCHEACKPGGLMVHCFPFTGLIDHGFYAIQPTLIRDLAAANGYEILHWAIASIGGGVSWLDASDAHGCIADLHARASANTLPDQSWHHVAFRKPGEASFRVPVQHHYRDASTVAEHEEWLACR